MARDTLTQCPECDLLQLNPVLPPGAAALCARCGAPLHRNRPDSLESTLALTLAGLILFLVANSFPFLSLEMQGQVRATTLATGGCCKPIVAGSSTRSAQIDSARLSTSS